MLTEIAIAAVAKAVLEVAAEETAVGAIPRRQLRAWLKGDEQQLACQVALARALSQFGEDFPEWRDALFDEHFLTHRGAPVLAMALSPSRTPSGDDLASAWGAQFNLRPDSDDVGALQPAAAEFLRWWQEELAAVPELRPLFQSKAEVQLIASVAASVRSVDRLRDELGRALLTLRFPGLDAYVDWPSVRRVRAARRGFVGRDWLVSELDRLADDLHCGYIHVVADAGLGKTSFSAAFAAQHAAAAYFAELGSADVGPCLRHLSAQLIERFELRDDYAGDARASAAATFLRVLDKAAAASEEPLWLVIDGLDELPQPEPEANPLLLPRQLPSNAFVLLSHGPGEFTLRVEAGVPQREIVLRSDDPRHQADIEAFIVDRLAAQAQESTAGDDQDESVSRDIAPRLLRASEGSFMYLTYLLDDKDTLSSLDPDDLPAGLDGYYERMWAGMESMAGPDRAAWDGLFCPVIERLSAAAEPVTADWLADHVGTTRIAVQDRALRKWRRFLSHNPASSRWRIIHRSFRDYRLSGHDRR